MSLEEQRSGQSGAQRMKRSSESQLLWGFYVKYDGGGVKLVLELDLWPEALLTSAARIITNQ